MRDTLDHGEREEWFCAGDGTQDSGFGSAFGQAFASEGETGSAEKCQENSDHGGEDALLLVKLRDSVDQLLAVRLYGLDGGSPTGEDQQNRFGAGVRHCLGVWLDAGRDPTPWYARPRIVEPASF